MVCECPSSGAAPPGGSPAFQPAHSMAAAQGEGNTALPRRSCRTVLDLQDLLSPAAPGSVGNESRRGVALGRSDVGHCSVCTDVREPGQCHRGGVRECCFAGAVPQHHAQLQHRYERRWCPPPAQGFPLLRTPWGVPGKLILAQTLLRSVLACAQRAGVAPEISLLQRKVWLPAGALPTLLAGGLGMVEILLVSREAELCA